MAGVAVGVVDEPGALEPAARLAELERIVEVGVAGFLAAGVALEEIHREGLYRVTHESWRGYLADRWRFSVQTAHRLESGALCAQAIMSAGLELPASATPELLRPLGPVLRERGGSGVVAAWQTVLEAHGGSCALSGERVRAILASSDAP